MTLDKTCHLLVEQYKILTPLKQVIELEIKDFDASIKTKLREIVRVLHSAAGAIKNLTVSSKFIVNSFTV